MSKKEKAPNEKRRFWRPRRSLPSVLWDGKYQKAKVEFSKLDGSAIVERRDFQDELLSMGYIEVALDAKTPPTPMDDSPNRAMQIEAAMGIRGGLRDAAPASAVHDDLSLDSDVPLNG